MVNEMDWMHDDVEYMHVKQRKLIGGPVLEQPHNSVNMEDYSVPLL